MQLFNGKKQCYKTGHIVLSFGKFICYVWYSEIRTAMKSIETLDKTLAWSYFKDQEKPGSTWDIAGFLHTLGLKSQAQLLGSELADQGYQQIDWYAGKKNFHGSLNIAGKKSKTPEEVNALTQVILHTLNSDPNKFHDMSQIPGLESKAWTHLSEITHYLLKQGWIEASAKDDKLYVKLTFKGSIYLRSLDLNA